MQEVTSVVAASLAALWLLFSGIFSQQKAVATPVPESEEVMQASDRNVFYNAGDFRVILKDVGEAYLGNFGLNEADFEIMKSLGVSTIEGNFDICAGDEDVKYFLDESEKVGIKVIMPAGAGEAEWGYDCKAKSSPEEQKPVWNKAGVTAWVNKWKNHPAVIAWDTSNEAGSTFPNANEEHKERMLTAEQLQQAYADVKAADPDKPVMIRMNGWYFYDYESDFFREGNPFAENTADIVMVNAYSNVDEYFDDFVATLISRSKSSIHSIDPRVKIVVALGVWQEPPLWSLPTKEHFLRDQEAVKMHGDVLGTAYFKYGAKGSEWYLPTDAPELMGMIK